jgi:hypothetical protein
VGLSVDVDLTVVLTVEVDLVVVLRVVVDWTVGLKAILDYLFFLGQKMLLTISTSFSIKIQRTLAFATVTNTTI